MAKADDSLNELNFKRLPRKLAIQAIGIHPETFDHWVNEGCKPVEGKGQTAYYDLGQIFRWRIEKAENSRKPIKKEKIKKDDGETVDVSDSKLKELILKEDLRKKKIENDEREGLLVNKKEMEDLFFRMGRALRDNLMSKNTVWGPQLNMVSGFEATTYLRKECEKLCNSLAYLNNISDEELAHEYHEYFMLGFNYAKGNQ